MNDFKDPVEIHSTLNPVLWDGTELRPEVQTALLRISDEFYNFLNVSAPVYDVIISGSQANYNYTEDSDLDLHVIIDFKEIACEEPIEELFNAKVKLWKSKHDINVYGINVELYVEDLGKPAITSSYSLLKKSWIKIPERKKVEYNKSEVIRVFKIWAKLINFLIRSRDLEMCLEIMNMLKDYRKLGLQDSGEFGVPNLVFKSLRNNGYIERLSNTITELTDSKLSID